MSHITTLLGELAKGGRKLEKLSLSAGELTHLERANQMAARADFDLARISPQERQAVYKANTELTRMLTSGGMDARDAVSAMRDANRDALRKAFPDDEEAVNRGMQNFRLLAQDAIRKNTEDQKLVAATPAVQAAPAAKPDAPKPAEAPKVDAEAARRETERRTERLAREAAETTRVSNLSKAVGALGGHHDSLADVESKVARVYEFIGGQGHSIHSADKQLPVSEVPGTLAAGKNVHADVLANYITSVRQPVLKETANSALVDALSSNKPEVVENAFRTLSRVYEDADYKKLVKDNPKIDASLKDTKGIAEAIVDGQIPSSVQLSQLRLARVTEVNNPAPASAVPNPTAATPPTVAAPSTPPPAAPAAAATPSPTPAPPPAATAGGTPPPAPPASTVGGRGSEASPPSGKGPDYDPADPEGRAGAYNKSQVDLLNAQIRQSVVNDTMKSIEEHKMSLINGRNQLWNGLTSFQTAKTHETKKNIYETLFGKDNAANPTEAIGTFRSTAWLIEHDSLDDLGGGKVPAYASFDADGKPLKEAPEPDKGRIPALKSYLESDERRTKLALWHKQDLESDPKKAAALRVEDLTDADRAAVDKQMTGTIRTPREIIEQLQTKRDLPSWKIIESDDYDTYNKQVRRDILTYVPPEFRISTVEYLNTRRYAHAQVESMLQTETVRDLRTNVLNKRNSTEFDVAALQKYFKTLQETANSPDFIEFVPMSAGAEEARAKRITNPSYARNPDAIEQDLNAGKRLDLEELVQLQNHFQNVIKQQNNLVVAREVAVRTFDANKPNFLSVTARMSPEDIKATQTQLIEIARDPLFRNYARNSVTNLDPKTHLMSAGAIKAEDTGKPQSFLAIMQDLKEGKRVGEADVNAFSAHLARFYQVGGIDTRAHNLSRRSEERGGPPLWRIGAYSVAGAVALGGGAYALSGGSDDDQTPARSPVATAPVQVVPQEQSSGIFQPPVQQVAPPVQVAPQHGPSLTPKEPSTMDMVKEIPGIAVKGTYGWLKKSTVDSTTGTELMTDRKEETKDTFLGEARMINNALQRREPGTLGTENLEVLSSLVADRMYFQKYLPDKQFTGREGVQAYREVLPSVPAELQQKLAPALDALDRDMGAEGDKVRLPAPAPSR